MHVERRLDPTLLALVIAYFLLLMAGGSSLRAAFRVPHDATAASYVATNLKAIQLGSLLEMLSALALGVFMAISISRLRHHGTHEAGAQIATIGSVGTPVMLALSALATWSLTRPGVAEAPGSVITFQSLGFDGGAPGFAMFLGCFVGGVSIAAGRSGLIPRWLMWLGVVVAAASELATLTLVNFQAGYFVPACRFGSIVWMLGLAFTMPAGTTKEGGEV